MGIFLYAIFTVSNNFAPLIRGYVALIIIAEYNCLGNCQILQRAKGYPLELCAKRGSNKYLNALVIHVKI